MKLKVLGCFGGTVPGVGMTSFLVDGRVALDAGSVTQALTLREQCRIEHVFVSHSHLDHTASLPLLIDNNFSAPGFSLRVYAVKEVLAAVRDHLFNNATWPDFTTLPDPGHPVLRLVELREEEPVVVRGLHVRAVRVSHTVPTTGFVVEGRGSALVFTSDTGPTQRIWDVANATPKLRAVVTEVSFPSTQQRLADVSGHLTPATLARELRKLTRDVRVYLYGRKPRFADAIARELKDVPDERVRLLVQGRTYTI